MQRKILTMLLIMFATSFSTSCAQFDDEEYMLDGSGSIRNVDSPFADDILELVNEERISRGIAPLELSHDLNDSAAIRAEEITEVFSHTRPDGSSCFSIISGSYQNVGENIAAGSSTPEAVMEQWMNSSGHRANILNPDFTELGVGYVYEDGTEYGHYWVQLFRRP